MPGHQAHQCLRFVRVQLIDNEDPTCSRTGSDHRFNVVGEVRLGPGRTQPCLYDSSCGHSKAGNQGQGPVTDVLKLAQGRLAFDHGTGYVLALKGLDARFLIGRDDIDARLRQLLRRQVQGTQGRHGRVKAPRVFGPLVIEPIPPLMRFEIGLFLKNAPPSGGKSSLQGRV